MDLDTGLITMVTAPASTGGTGPGGEELLSCMCNYHIPVRFDVDQLVITMETAVAGGMPGLPVIETRQP